MMAAVGEVIEAQAFVLGEPVSRFERTLAAMAGATHAIGVASGTDALVLALRALDVRPGDRVLVPSLTFVASAEAVVAVGARPVFVDVDAASLTLDPVQAEIALARARAAGDPIRGVVPVHLFGQPAPARTLVSLARTYGAVVVEDAAQAVLGCDGDQPVGAIGDAGCFSFFPAKNLGAWGDAGAVTTNDLALAQRVRRLRQHGAIPGSPDQPIEEPGMNSRLDAIQAAVLDVKARYLEAWTRAREAVAARYHALLGDLPGLVLPRAREGSRHVYHQFVVRTARRDELAAHLKEEGIASRAYYTRPVHRHPAYAGYERGPLPETEAASQELLALPIYAELTLDTQARVAHAVRTFFT
jgi:dTDP-4-amino-4,6-dideoxygalactose transaminase